jgi:hypothetical protein
MRQMDYIARSAVTFFRWDAYSLQGIRKLATGRGEKTFSAKEKNEMEQQNLWREGLARLRDGGRRGRAWGGP